MWNSEWLTCNIRIRWIVDWLFKHIILKATVLISRILLCNGISFIIGSSWNGLYLMIELIKTILSVCLLHMQMKLGWGSCIIWFILEWSKYVIHLCCWRWQIRLRLWLIIPIFLLTAIQNPYWGVSYMHNCLVFNVKISPADVPWCARIIFISWNLGLGLIEVISSISAKIIFLALIFLNSLLEWRSPLFMTLSRSLSY